MTPQNKPIDHYIQDGSLDCKVAYRTLTNMTIMLQCYYVHAINLTL
jgi:hypothetical protein